MTDDPGVRCPFLGQAVEARTLICLADIEPVAVSRRYGDSYCLTPGHVNCSLYISAIVTNRSAAPPILEPIEIVTERVPAGPPPTEAEPAPPLPDIVEVPSTPISREQAIELAQDLSSAVDDLVQRVRLRKAANEALLRQMRTLEEMAENPAFLRRMLATGERQPMSAEDLGAVQTSLQTLMTNPQDLTGLVSLAEQSPKLEQAINACLQVLKLVS